MTTGLVRAVLWDFGGVISTSPFEAFTDYEVAHGLEPGVLRRVNSTNPDTNAWARFERSETTLAEFAVEFEAETAAAGARVDTRVILENLRGELRPAMVEAVRRCHGRFKTALVTNNFVAETTDPHQEIRHLFDAVVESSKVGFRKPDPYFYEAACRLLGVEPHEAVYLDDLGINLKPARAMGMHTIKVVDPVAALVELEAVVGIPLIS